MGGALSYLYFTKFKNSLREFIKKPARLIYIIIFAALLFTTVKGGEVSENAVFRNTDELFSIVAAYYTLIFCTVINRGFTDGANVFSLSDVNLIFTSPLSSRKVLFYGLFQQMGSSLLLGFFILFQYSWMHSSYGITFGGLFIVLIGYALTLFAGQMTSMIIYMYTSGNDERLKRAKAAFYGTLGVFAAYLVYAMATGGEMSLARLCETVAGRIFLLFPASGWATSIVKGIFTADVSYIFIGAGLLLLYFAGVVAYILFGRQDYYEDVLRAAETTHSAIAAAKEGQGGERLPQNIKLGKTGFNKGEGAVMLFYKHMLENRRSGRFLIPANNVIFAVMTIIMSFFLKNIGPLAIFAASAYMQLFASAMGRLNKELGRPYIYMMPESPFKKLLFAITESLVTAAVESVFIFGLLIPIAVVAPTEALLMMLGHITFALLFCSGNILVERIFGSIKTKALVFMFYFAVMLLITAPGVVTGILVAGLPFAAGAFNTIFLLCVSLVNIPIALLILFLCRNLLANVEMNN